MLEICTKLKCFTMDLQLFGGGKSETTTTAANVLPASEDQTSLQKLLTNYSNNAMSTAGGLLNSTNNALSNYNNLASNTNYSDLYKSGTDKYNSAYSTLTDLSNGKLSDAYTKNMTDSIKSGVQNTLGNMVNSLGTSGVLNSSVTDKNLYSQNQTVADTMSKNFLNNISTSSNLANSLLSSAYTPLTTAQTANNTALSNLSSLLSNANTATAIPASVWQALLNQQTALSSPGTTTTTTSPDFFSSLLTGASNAATKSTVG